MSVQLDRPDPADLERLETTDQFPRVSLFQRTLGSETLDERFLQKVPRIRRTIYKFLPVALAQVIEAYIIRTRYDIVISWAERLGFPLALLLHLPGKRIPHITLSGWISKPKKAWFLKLVHHRIDRIIIWSSVQRDYTLNVLKIPQSKVTCVRKGQDLRFWRPMDTKPDMICAVGTEMRDYLTLIAAMQGLDIRCHIAAGIERGQLPETVKIISSIHTLPPNVTLGRKPYTELRDLYARSRFVVVPLLPTDTDNGLTCILESMAMGKPVICSRTRGQVDILEEGKTGIFVPPGDVQALREAILYLWHHPEIAGSMGREARKLAEEKYSIEQFVESVRGVAEEVVNAGQTDRSGKSA